MTFSSLFPLNFYCFSQTQMPSMAGCSTTSMHGSKLTSFVISSVLSKRLSLDVRGNVCVMQCVREKLVIEVVAGALPPSY